MAPACFDHHIDPSLCTHRVARLWLSKWQPRCVSTEATKEREGKEQQNLLYMGRVKKEAVSKRGVKKLENLFNEGEKFPRKKEEKGREPLAVEAQKKNGKA